MEYENQMLRQELTSEQEVLVNSIVDKNKKSVWLSYVMFVFLWIAQAHNIYLKKYLSAFFSYGLFVLFLLTINSSLNPIQNVGVVAFVVFVLFNLKDLALIPSYVKKYNQNLEHETLLKALGRADEPVVGLSKGRTKNNPQKSESPSKTKGALDSISLSINRLFVLKGRIRNQIIKDELEKTYGLLVKIRENVEKNDIKEPEVNQLHSYYLPDLLSVLEKYDSLEKEDYFEHQTQEVLTEIIDLLKKIEDNMKGIIDGAKKDKHNDLSVDIKTMKRIMEIDDSEY